MENSCGGIERKYLLPRAFSSDGITYRGIEGNVYRYEGEELIQVTDESLLLKLENQFKQQKEHNVFTHLRKHRLTYRICGWIAFSLLFQLTKKK